MVLQTSAIGNMDIRRNGEDRSTHDMQPSEKTAFNIARKKMRDDYEREISAKNVEAAKLARKIWSNAQDATDDHKYLKDKGVKSCVGLKVDIDGILIIPAAIDNDIVTLQFIKPDGNFVLAGVPIGNKKFLTGGKIKGAWFKIEGKEDIVYIAEGYSTAASVYQATGATVYVAFYAGNLYEVSAYVKSITPNSQHIIAADDDTENKLNTGRVKAEQAAKRLNIGLVFPQGYNDFNDQHKSEGLENLRSYLNNQKSFINHERSRFGFISVSDLTRDIKPPVWLIENYIEEHTLSCLFGASGTGKSFLTIDMACCIAIGKDYHGHKVKQGAVFYIAGEGQHGLSKRFKAWEIHNQTSLKDAPLYISKVAANLNDEQYVQEVMRAIQEIYEDRKVKPVLIVVDTLARNFGDGDENSTKDMTKYISNLDVLKNNWGAACLTVHHSGLQDANRGRGSGALKAAMDHEYCAHKNGKIIELQCKKSKDSEEPPTLEFKLQFVPIIHAYGNIPLRGAALSLQDGNSKPHKLSKNEATGIAILQESLDEYGEDIDILSDGNTVKAVLLKNYKDRLKIEKISKSDKVDSIDKAVSRIIKSINKLGYIILTEDYIAFSDIPDNVGQI